RAGLFPSRTARAFTDFVEPVELPPIDAGRGMSLVEGPPSTVGRARTALVALQERGQLAFGGFFGDGAGLAVVSTPRAAQAIEWLAAGGGWEPGRLTVRPWSQTL